MIKDLLQRMSAPEHIAYQLLPHVGAKFCLDIGAASGALTKYIKGQVPDAEVISIEPFDGNIPLFHRTTEGLSGVKLIQAAAGAEVGVTEFFTGATVQQGHMQGYSSGGYLMREGMKRNPERIQRVPVVMVDTIADRHVDFVKIDVQGGEADVLRGAQKTMHRFGIDMMFIEFEDDVEILKILDANGYHIFDGEYAACNREEDWAREHMRDFEMGTLTTGKPVARGYIKDSVPRDFEGFTEWIAQYKSLQTDLVVVHDSFMPKFMQALEAWEHQKEIA